ncbi:MAG: peptidoglycan-binding protein [Thermocrispum sp.]
MTAAGQRLDALDDPAGDRPRSMDAIDKHAQQAEKLDARAVNDQAGKVGGAATSANDLGDDLKVFREDVLREWDGKDAEAVADHLEKLSKASYKVSDKAEAAKNILQRVSEILEEVKKKVTQLAKEANDDDADNRKLIGAARQRKNSSDDDNEIAAAASDIERLRQLNEKDANGKKDEIEQALDAAEKEIDALLKPLGLEIEGGFLELLPAGSGQTSASSASSGPIDVGGGPGSSTGSGSGGGGDYSAGVAPGSGSPTPVEVTGDNPAAIAEGLMGRTAAELMASGALPMDNVPPDVSCANFVTAVLQEAGWIDWHSNSVSSGDMQAKLKADGWTSVPISEAPPGSVVISNGGGHTVMVGDGDPAFIGSNNNLPDGSQSISAGGEGGMVEVLAPPPHLLEGTTVK